MYIGNKEVGADHPVYFIAEIGSNFDQDMGRAKELIHLAKEAGADAAKFQHYTAKTLVSDTGFKALGSAQSHQASWKKSVYETYQDASLDQDWTAELKEACDAADITFFSSPYSMDLVDYIDPYVPAFKVGSGDITWLEIIERMASKGKPVLIATGASDLIEVERAIGAATAINEDVILMQCNTNYTASDDNFSHIHLNVLKTYGERFPNALLGLSDHMPGHVTVLGAVSLGARVIEKHFTDSVDRDGPDHPFSMTPATWREMVDRTRELEAALGSSIKRVEKNEEQTIIAQRRCVRAVKDLAPGHVLQRDDVTYLRPCPVDSVAPMDVDTLLGHVIQTNIKSGDHLTVAHITPA